MGRWSRRVGGWRTALERLEARDTPAAIGALDPSFGTLGTATTPFTGVSRAAAVLVQPDGKVVVAGTADEAGVIDFALARYNPDGTLDPTFSNDGVLMFGLAGADFATSLALQPDGSIVAAGYTSAGGTASNPNDVALIRVTANGAADPTFNVNGSKTIDFGANDRATGVVVQPDGKIVVVGSSGLPGGSNFIAARLNADGSLDTTFGTGGKQTVDLGGIDDANAVLLQPDGKLVLVGTQAPAGAPMPGGVTANFAVARLNTDGSLDTSFDTDGKQTVDFGTIDAANAAALQPDGRIVLAGVSGSDFAYARLNANGSLDTSFSGDGKLTLDLGGTDVATGVAVQPDGRIVASGFSNGNGVVTRITSAGSLDPAFSGDGVASYGTGTAVTTGGVALTPAGRIVAVGGAQVNGGGTASFVVSRLIGSLEEGKNLAVGGSPSGSVAIYTPATGTSGYTPTPAATLSPFGTLSANLRTAVGDVNGDGVPDTILVTGPGVPIRVAVIDGRDNASVLVAAFDPFGGDFTGGGFVAAGDFNHDGRSEIVVTPDQGGGPRVSVFTLLPAGVFTAANFFGIDDPGFRGGARVAAGDINGDGTTDLVVAAGFGGGPRVAVYDGRTVYGGTPAKLVNDFFVFDPVLRNGVYVAAGDVNGDGLADIVFGAGPGGAPRLLIASGATLMTGRGSTAVASPLSNFFVAGDVNDRGGVRVATKDVDGDGKSEVVVGTGGGQASRVREYAGTSFTGTAEPTTFQDLDPFGRVLADGVYVG
jgi:uncharacterized delta-60 repeat protein